VAHLRQRSGGHETGRAGLMRAGAGATGGGGGGASGGGVRSAGGERSSTRGGGAAQAVYNKKAAAACGGGVARQTAGLEPQPATHHARRGEKTMPFVALCLSSALPAIDFSSGCKLHVILRVFFSYSLAFTPRPANSLFDVKKKRQLGLSSF
jgi:hypothetical protein